MIEILLDFSVLEVIFVMSLLYITCWSIIGSSDPRWTCHYFIKRNAYIDLRYNTNQIPDLGCFIFTINRRKIPALKDQQDEDDDAPYVSPSILMEK